jgi:hypothetical protein
MPVNDQQFPYASGDPPPWIISEPSPASPPPPHGSGGGRRPLILVAGLVVLLLLGGGAWFVARRLVAPSPAPAPSPIAVATTPVPVPPDDSGGGSGAVVTPTLEDTVTEPAPDPEQSAQARLDQLAQQDLGRVTLDGEWVAQLASKYPGITDKHQTTSGGSHTFAATDILEEHERLAQDPANGDAEVVLLKSTDYGIRQTVEGHPLYVTFAVGHFTSAAEVSSWCVTRFPDLPTTERANQCAVRRLKPPA